MTQLLSTYQKDLALRGFAERTCEHYTANVRQFLAHYQLPVEELDSEKIRHVQEENIVSRNPLDFFIFSISMLSLHFLTS